MKSALNEMSKARWIITISIILVLASSAFMKGLYFQREFIYIHLIVGALGLLVIPITLGEKVFKYNLLDIAVLALALVYSLAIIGSANLSAAIGESLRVWTYAFYYFLVSRTLVNRSHVILYAQGLLVVALFVALFGLMTVPGWISFSRSWTGVLSSTLQYHNALAAFMLGPMIITTYLWLSGSKFAMGSLYSIILFFLSLSLAGSQSRGGYIIFFLAIISFLFLARFKNRERVVLPLLNLLLGILIWEKFVAGANTPHSGASILWLVVGVVCAVLLQLANYSTDLIHKRLSRKKIVVLYSIAFIVIAVAGGYALIVHGGQVLGKIKEISLHTHSVEERFVFYYDSFKMLVQRPLIGYGGGGWASAYREFQSYLYFTQETHSIILKIAVETGLIGLTVLVTLLAGVFHMSFRYFRECKRRCGDNGLFLALIISFLAIGGHALIDFDLSEGAVSLLLWGILALMRGLVILDNSSSDPDGGPAVKTPRTSSRRPIGKDSNLARSVVFGIVVTIGVVLITVPWFILMGLNAGEKAMKNVSLSSNSKVLEYSKSARVWFPFESEYWSISAQAQFVLAKGNNDIKKMKLAVMDMKKAVDLNRYEPQMWTALANMQATMGQFEEANEAAESILNLAPFYTTSYETYAQIEIEYAIKLVQNGEIQTAKSVVDKVISLPDFIKNKVESLDPIFKRNWVSNEKLISSSKINLAVARGRILNGSYTSLDLELLKEDTQTVKNSKIWLAAIANTKSDVHDITKITEDFSQQDFQNVTKIEKLIGVLK